MEFSLAGEVLSIYLTARDLSRLELCAETFSMQQGAHRARLYELLDVARMETGFSLPEGELSVQLYPLGEQGACFYIRPRKSFCGVSVYRFFSEDCLLAARGLLRGRQGELFFYRGAVFVALDEPCEELTEFSSRCGTARLRAYLCTRAIRASDAFFRCE